MVPCAYDGKLPAMLRAAIGGDVDAQVMTSEK